MNSRPSLVVKVGGSLLRERNYGEARNTLTLLAEVASSKRLLLANGSLDLPSTTETYLAHLGRVQPRLRLELLAREMVSETLASTNPLFSIARGIPEAEFIWALGQAPILSSISFGAWQCNQIEVAALSSTGLAYLAATSLGASGLLALTDVNGIWLDENTKRVERVITTDTLRNLPSCCIDVGLADLIDRHGLPITVMNGLQPAAVGKFLEREFASELGTRVVPSPSSPSEDLAVISTYLIGSGFCSKGDLCAARGIANAADYGILYDWDHRARIDIAGPANQAAYTIAIALERLGAALSGGVLRPLLFFALCADQVCEDWFSCRSWIRSYREIDDQAFQLGFRRRFAEFCFATCAAYLLQRCGSLLSESYRERLLHERLQCGESLAQVQREAGFIPADHLRALFQ